jgi:protein kinase A
MNDSCYNIVMEWASGGDVFTFINKNSRRHMPFLLVGESAVRFILGCVVLGLEYLHSHNIVYADMKPENLLIFEDGYIKLNDFVLSVDVNEGPREIEQAGTTLYFAPELVSMLPCGKTLDLWTLGVLAYELSNFIPPFSNSQILRKETFPEVVKTAES